MGHLRSSVARKTGNSDKGVYRPVSAPSLNSGSEFVDHATNGSDEFAAQASVADVVRRDLRTRAANIARARRDERIAARAYELAQQRGFTPGAELDDWLTAEREIDDAGPLPSPSEQFAG